MLNGMVTICVANESNMEASCGEDHYYLSSGKTLETCKRNFLKKVRTRWNGYDYRADVCGDVSSYLKSNATSHDDYLYELPGILKDLKEQKVIEISGDLYSLLIEGLAA